MARSRNNQAVTLDSNDLVIGLGRLRIITAADITAAGANITAGEIGAVKATAAVGEATVKEHKAGYPQQTDKTITEQTDFSIEFTPEEVGSANVYGLIDEVISQVNTGTVAYKQVELTFQRYDGTYTTIFSNHCAIASDLSISWDDDWSGIAFKAEWHYPSSYTNNLAFYPTTTTAAARSRDLMPLSEDVTDLAIGRAQVRIGNITAGSSTATTATDQPAGWDQTYSVGALASCSLSFNATYKDHYSGYPKKKDATMLESSDVKLEFEMEEFDTTMHTGIVTGTATKIFDILNDSLINDKSYYASAYVQWELVEGGSLAFWIPNGKFSSDLKYEPKDDWSAFPVVFTAEKQTGTNLIYRVDP